MLRRLAPGLILAAAVAAAARLLHQAVPPSAGKILGEVIFAVALGIAVGNLVRLPESVAPGVRFAFQSLLRVAIVLLGAGFSFLDAMKIGGKALGMVVVLMLLALAAAHALGRAAGVPPKLSTLIGVGTAVCGNSAISATAPVIGASDEEVAFAIATNTLFGTAAVLAYPLLGHLLAMGDAAFGTWAGTAVNDTSQVVATGFAFSAAAGGVATVVKLTRNALMGAVIVGVGLLHSGHAAGEGSRVPFVARLKQSVPPFVVGFLALAAGRTLGAFDALSTAAGTDVPARLNDAAKLLILVALAGVGLGTRLHAMRRIGWKPFAVGLVTALVTAGTSFALILWLGPAGGP